MGKMDSPTSPVVHVPREMLVALQAGHRELIVTREANTSAESRLLKIMAHRHNVDKHGDWSGGDSIVTCTHPVCADLRDAIALLKVNQPTESDWLTNPAMRGMDIARAITNEIGDGRFFRPAFGGLNILSAKGQVIAFFSFSTGLMHSCEQGEDL